jgi:hypothetical protein
MLKAVELLGRVVEGVFGLRFFLSADYRRRTRDRWRKSSAVEVAVECFGAALGITVLVLLAFLALRAM